MNVPASPHRFRFFVDAACAAGTLVELPADEREHVRVLRLRPGAQVELVDRAACVWLGEIVDAATARPVELLERREPAEPEIELLAGALTGSAFDELVDGAVQAGATRIVPIASNAKDRERMAARVERLQRISWSAAKQSKRSRIPDVAAPVGADELADWEPGIVLDPSAEQSLLDVAMPAAPVRLLVGPAEGFPAELVDALVGRGWARARLTPSILRAELAAAVAVAVVATRTAR